MSKRLSTEQKHFAAKNIEIVKNFAVENGIEEGSEEECELNYRFIHAVSSFKEEKGDIRWYVSIGLNRGIKTINRKNKRFINTHTTISPKELLRKEVLPLHQKTYVEPEKISYLLNKANISELERKVINLYYRNKISKKNICNRLSLTRYKLDKVLEEAQNKIHKIIKKNNMNFNYFIK